MNCNILGLSFDFSLASLVCTAAVFLRPSHQTLILLLLGTDLLGEAILSGCPQIVPNTSQEGSYNDDLDRIGGTKLRTLMIAPLVTVNGEVWGYV